MRREDVPLVIVYQNGTPSLSSIFWYTPDDVLSSTYARLDAYYLDDVSAQRPKTIDDFNPVVYCIPDDLVSTLNEAYDPRIMLDFYDSDDEGEDKDLRTRTECPEDIIPY